MTDIIRIAAKIIIRKPRQGVITERKSCREGHKDWNILDADLRAVFGETRVFIPAQSTARLLSDVDS